MATRTISQTWQVEGVLTNVTSAKLSDPTGTYGVKRNDNDAVVVADGTAMTNTATGTYNYSFDDVEDVAYTAYVELVYNGVSYWIEQDLVARTSVGDMLATYNTLLEEIGWFLFGISSGYSTAQTTGIERCIKHGLNEVYGAHPWSFLRPTKEIVTTAPYTTGTIEVASGVVTLTGGTFPSWAAVGVLKISNDYYQVDSRDGDTQITLEDTSVDVDSGTSYQLGRPEYDLPTGFEAILGHELYYEPGQSDFYPPIKERSDAQLRAWHQDDPFHDRPLYFSTRVAEFDATAGSKRRLALYPTPDAAYVIKAPMQLRQTMIDESNLYPIGAEMLSQLITEACLAAAERNFDERDKRHTEKYQQMLPQVIARDLELSTPATLGRDAPGGQKADSLSRSVRMGDVTINGVTM